MPPQEFVIPRVYTPHYFQQEYDDITILGLYLEIRFIEEKEVALNELQKKNLFNETIELARLKTCAYAVDFFETIIGQTYDYSGSLTDLLYRAKLRRDEEINVLSST